MEGTRMHVECGEGMRMSSVMMDLKKLNDMKNAVRQGLVDLGRNDAAFKIKDQRTGVEGEFAGPNTPELLIGQKGICHGDTHRPPSQVRLDPIYPPSQTSTRSFPHTSGPFKTNQMSGYGIHPKAMSAGDEFWAGSGLAALPDDMYYRTRSAFGPSHNYNNSHPWRHPQAKEVPSHVQFAVQKPPYFGSPIGGTMSDNSHGEKRNGLAVGSPLGDHKRSHGHSIAWNIQTSPPKRRHQGPFRLQPISNFGSGTQEKKRQQSNASLTKPPSSQVAPNSVDEIPGPSERSNKPPRPYPRESISPQEKERARRAIVDDSDTRSFCSLSTQGGQYVRRNSNSEYILLTAREQPRSECSSQPPPNGKENKAFCPNPIRPRRTCVTNKDADKSTRREGLVPGTVAPGSYTRVYLDRKKKGNSAHTKSSSTTADSVSQQSLGRSSSASFSTHLGPRKGKALPSRIPRPPRCSDTNPSQVPETDTSIPKPPNTILWPLAPKAASHCSGSPEQSRSRWQEENREVAPMDPHIIRDLEIVRLQASIDELNNKLSREPLSPRERFWKSPLIAAEYNNTDSWANCDFNCAGEEIPTGKVSIRGLKKSHTQLPRILPSNMQRPKVTVRERRKGLGGRKWQS